MNNSAKDNPLQWATMALVVLVVVIFFMTLNGANAESISKVTNGGVWLVKELIISGVIGALVGTIGWGVFNAFEVEVGWGISFGVGTLLAFIVRIALKAWLF